MLPGQGTASYRRREGDADVMRQRQDLNVRKSLDVGNVRVWWSKHLTYQDNSSPQTSSMISTSACVMFWLSCMSIALHVSFAQQL